VNDRYSNAVPDRADSTETNDVQKPKPFQLLEKKGKCCRFIAPIIVGPENGWTG